MKRGIVSDNTTLAVAKLLGDGTRQRTQSFSELHSHSFALGWVTRINDLHKEKAADFCV